MKVCAQHSAAIKKAREMVGHSRDGNEGNMEYIIKSSHKPVGCPHLELFPGAVVISCPMEYRTAEGQKGWGHSGGVHQQDLAGGQFDIVSKEEEVL